MNLANMMSGGAMTQTVELVTVLEALQDLLGYSGVGADGNPLCTHSWNSALRAAEQVLLERVHGTV